MSRSILEKVRRLNLVLSESSSGFFSFDELCDIMSELLDSSIYVLNSRGKVLAAKFDDGEHEPMIRDEKTKKLMLPHKYNRNCLRLSATRDNLVGEELDEFFSENYSLKDKYHTIVPIIFGGNRIATLILSRFDCEYDESDIAICEYGATLVGIEVSRGIALEKEEDKRLKESVEIALGSLSYSEAEAVMKLFEELEGDEGLLVASKIADRFGVTRSVIVNALRKLESAGVIDSRSLGMKGTRIKITNEFFREGLDALYD